MGDVQSQVLQVSSPRSSLAVDQVAQGSQVLGLCDGAAESLIWVLLPPRGFRCGCPLWVSDVGAQASDRGACPYRRFGPVSPDSRPSDLGTHCSQAVGLCARAAKPLIRLRAHLGFQVWAPSPLICVCVDLASAVCWGCLSGLHSPGFEVVGEQEATAAVESSLNS